MASRTSPDRSTSIKSIADIFELAAKYRGRKHVTGLYACTASILNGVGVHNKVISGFQALCKIRAATEWSPQISGPIRYSLCHRRSLASPVDLDTSPNPFYNMLFFHSGEKIFVGSPRHAWFCASLLKHDPCLQAFGSISSLSLNVFTLALLDGSVVGRSPLYPEHPGSNTEPLCLYGVPSKARDLGGFGYYNLALPPFFRRQVAE
ncbi:hypothetical protein PoB_001933500 [Plakobranchus ocellatus]|uniref:TLDc domain-containing protein n=1 Tax=Plakobranchus ocellatus TaxID=259542 RepID=A0AAV3ZE29_9GAST|nr:hypothetical protein PoB_001933500 [Plakobranchus ocellatus]